MPSLAAPPKLQASPRPARLRRITRRCSLILNFTAYDYHWGCHGTSSEIYQSLAERDYQVNWLDVHETHALAPHPRSLADFTSTDFVRDFFGRHPHLERLLGSADLVVVNGEGTLHHLRKGPLNLLFLMHLAQNVFERPVHLINHSFFPSGDDTPDAEADEVYGAVARCLARVVPREPLSRAVLARLGVETTQGFDCLPRYLARHNRAGASRRSGPLVLSGGVNMEDAAAATVAAALRPLAEGGRRVRFLTGAKANPAGEDHRIFKSMQTSLPQLELVEAPDMETWIQTLAEASCLISGRYHHSLAAAALGTPFVAFPSNTPKLDATCAFLGLPPPVAYDDRDFAAKTTSAVEAALAGRAPLLSGDARRRMLQGAEANFAGL